MPRKIPYPNSIITRVKTIFVYSTPYPRLSILQVLHILCEEDYNLDNDLSLYNSVSSMVSKLVKSGFLQVTDIKTKRNGNIYQYKPKQEEIL